MQSSENATSLPLRARRVIQVDGSEVVEVSVFCTHQRRSVPVEGCGTCAHWAGISLTQRAASSLVLCADVPEPPSCDGPDPPVGSLMTRDVVCAAPEVPVRILIATLVELGISGLPIVDAAGRPVGILTQTDILAKCTPWTAEDERKTAASVLTPLAFTLREDAPISRAAALMAFEHVHRIPVVDEQGAVVGVVSALDIARWLGREAGWLAR